MTSTRDSKSLRTFLIVWVGQLVSTLGSSMSSFAITLWVWQLTAQATSLALIGFFSLVASILISPIAGAIVDRSNRKLLLIVGDTVSVLTILVIVLLYLTHHLQIWHFYLAGALRGAFNQLQNLAYSASLSLVLPDQHYSRAGGLQFLSSYGSSIFGPALAGVLYYVIGLVGILLLDLLSFVVAIISVLVVAIPQPLSRDEVLLTTHEWTHWGARLTEDLRFGWCYLQAHPSLGALLVAQAMFMFAHDLGGSIFAPMILARSGNNARALGSISAAGGVGGVSSALLTATWGGPSRRVQGVLLGMVGAGVSKTVVGLGQTLWIWLPAQACSSFNFPMMGGCQQAIWLAKVPPQVQGRVFAFNQMILQTTVAIARLVAGPLADRIFEPAVRSSGWLASVFGSLVGTGSGAGLSLLYILSSLGLLLVGLGGYAWPILRQVEDLVPDHPDHEVDPPQQLT